MGGMHRKAKKPKPKATQHAPRLGNGQPSTAKSKGIRGMGGQSATHREHPSGVPKIILLSGGNPQIAMADGDAPVKAYIEAMPGWKSGFGHRLDALIVRTIPDVRKAVKWNSPFYGISGQGWFLSFHTFANYVKVTFFQGTSLQPIPTGGKAKDARWIDIREDNFNEVQMTAWVRQAAALPGWGKS